MQTYGYSRVSTREQADSSHALEQQIARAEANGAKEILFDRVRRREQAPKFIYGG